ncbi:outer membrane protein assembly factor BamB family protein [Streptomyces sp. DSM 118878]
MSAAPLDADGLPCETAGPRERRPARGPAPGRRGTRIALPVALALLAVPLITAAHHSRPAPYGDRLTVHARVDGAGPQAPPGLRTRGGAVQAYDRGSGEARWTYTRKGRTPLTLLTAPGHAFALWSDGLVTDTATETGTGARGARGGSVRWHRAIPASAAWLRTPEARGGAGVLRPLAPGARMLAVVTPHRIAAYRAADGDLRWVLPARRGCAFEPARSVRRGGALMVAQPCTGPAASWTSQVIAVDDYGRIVPGRTPLGNGDLAGGAARGDGGGRPEI